MRDINRREFLAVAGAAAVLSKFPRSAASFYGSYAGETRIFDEIEMSWCPDGFFKMGSPPAEPDRRPDEDQVQVTFGHGFWIAKREVTQGLWKKLMGKLPAPLTAGTGDDFPVYNVNYAEAEAFCRAQTRIAHAAGDFPTSWEYRLPTEAQWEYACRAGSKTATAFGDKLSSLQANFKGDFPYNGAEKGPTLGHTQAVGSYKPNAWGIYDMHGNVFEWCRDWYHASLPGGENPDLYSAKASATPNGDGTFSRVRRGGCWSDEGWACRSAFRLKYEPERRADHIGFRPVAVLTK